VNQAVGIAWNGQPVGGAFGSLGISIDLTPTQLGPVNVICATNIESSVEMGFNAFRVQSGAGQLVFGDNSTRQLVATLRPAAGVHTWINNSANPVVINPNFQIRRGGTAPGNVINFLGTGDFSITNALRFNNGAPSGNIKWDSTGTTIWASDGGNGTDGNTNLFNSPLGTVTINAGTVIIKSPGLLPVTPGANAITNNGTLLKLDMGASDTDTVGRTIFGTGPIQINSGTWTFTSSDSTFSGSITLNDGRLIAGGPETAGVGGPFGIGGTISFAGGTLGYSANNTFDYSGRFSAAAGQQYKIDTAGQNVTFSNNLSSSGGSLLKIGGGTLTLADTSSYSGATAINGGKLIFQSPKTGTGDITVADNATLGITETSGTQATPTTLTLGSSTGANLEFDNVTNTATAPLIAGTLSFAGTNTININSGTFSVGQSYPLLSWTNGSAPAVSLGVVADGAGYLNTNGSTIEFICSSVALTWTGTNGASWNAADNWTEQGVVRTYSDANEVVFIDTAPGETNVAITGVVAPEAVTANNNSLTYSITSSGANSVGGSARLSKDGSGTLILSGGTNTYTGVTTLKAGTLSVGVLADGGTGSDIGAATSGGTNLVFKGGTLRYTGSGANVNRLFTVTTAGGTINASGTDSLNLSNPGQISLGGRLTLTGTNAGNNTLAASLVGVGSLVVNGTGRWILTGTNTYGGGTIISNGILQIGASPSGEIGSGSIFNYAVLLFKRTGTLNVPGAISGNGSVFKEDTGTVILENNSTYTGGTVINAGALLVNGRIGPGTVTVNAGTLGGRGTIGGSVAVTVAGTLAPGSASIGALTISSNLTIAGNLAIELNKSLVQSNDFVAVNGGLTNVGSGTVTVANLGPALQVGDKFTLFDKPATAGATVTITGAGVNWANNLATDGSISVSSLIAGPTLNYTNLGNSLQFSWIGDFTLQSQTNNIAVGITTNWGDYPGGTSGVIVPMDAVNATVFFRLVSP
jgi:fibronectin-binding autotransporter adhesin